jgi:hypothetical protein
VCVVGANGCTWVVLDENGVFLILVLDGQVLSFSFVVLGFTQSFLANVGPIPSNTPQPLLLNHLPVSLDTQQLM